MNTTMLGLFSLGGGEVILILFILLFLATGALAIVALALWLGH